MRGIDYAWADPKPSAAQLRADGVGFVARYLSRDPSKNLTVAERAALTAAGIAICLVWETTADRMLSGWTGGAEDVRAADAMATADGLPGIPLYFAADRDCTPGEQGAVHSYLDAVASVIGRARTGMYGGYWPVSRAFDAGKITYGWQSYAWSRTAAGVDPGPHAVTVTLGGTAYWFDQRAQLRQVANGVHLAGLPGLEADLDDSMTTDFGQWPRPGRIPPPPPGPAITQWTEFDMARLPVLAEGARDVPGGGFWYVHRLQVLLRETGILQGITSAAGLRDDGVFGRDTARAVRDLEAHYRLDVDGGVAGPQVWSVLLTGSA
jgi:Rv2525c-like, glycoside hydrolase-like domain/Putative peptidoglycan binding domain